MSKTLTFAAVHNNGKNSHGTITHCPNANNLKLTGSFTCYQYVWCSFQMSSIKNLKFFRDCKWINVTFFSSLEDYENQKYGNTKTISMSTDENETEILNYICFMHEIDEVVIVYCLLKLNVIL